MTKGRKMTCEAESGVEPVNVIDRIVSGFRHSSLIALITLPGVAVLADPVPIAHATRTTIAPVLDGKLDDACWKATQPITGFRRYGSNEPASHQATGYIAFDDDNIYIAIRCDEPNPEAIVASAVSADDVFGDDSVEIFLKPHNNKTQFFQFGVSAGGHHFDAIRFTSGGMDAEWESPVDSASAIGNDHWSTEVRIPLYALALSPDVTSTWRVNLARNKKRPDSLSAIGVDGIYTEPHKYAELKGLDLDYGAYGIQVGEPQLAGKIDESGVSASATVGIRNKGTTRSTIQVARMAGTETLGTEEYTLNPGREVHVDLGLVKLGPATGAGQAVHPVLDGAAARQLSVTDASTGRQLGLSFLRYPFEFAPLEIDVTEPDKRIADEGVRLMAVRVTASMRDADRESGSVRLTVSPMKSDRALTSQVKSAPGRETSFTLDRATVPTGWLMLHAAFLDASGAAVATTSKSFENRAPRASGGKVLNNLVTELVDLDEAAIGEERTFPFTNPREGWVFFALTGDSALTLEQDPPVELISDLSDRSDLSDPSESRWAQEAMRWLPAGEHRLAAKGDELKTLIVHAIPELSFFRFPASTQLPHQQPVFTWDVLRKHVLHSYNVISVAGIMGREPRRTEDKALLEEWRDEGKRWLMPGHVPAYKLPPDMTADDAYEFWTDNMTYGDAMWNGIIVDEFGVGDFAIQTYGPMAEATRRLTADFPDKLFYPFCLPMAGVKEVKPLMEATIENGGFITWEWYEREEPNLARAHEVLESALLAGMNRWRAFLLDAPAHMILCMGYYSTPPMSLNENPAVDYKVWKDMQYHLAATHPSFEGLGGLMEWNAKYADEETVRWIARLHRHYAIEGNTNLLSDEYGFRYELPHLRNPDFDHGTKGWTVEAAESSSVRTGTIPGLGRLQGRVRGSSRGDNFVRMKRSASKPNQISQEIRDLEPGRLYTLKLITADYDDYKEGNVEKQDHAVTIRIDGVEMMADRSFKEVMQSSRGQEAPPFSRDRQPWFNHYWQLFRAGETTANLTISDWARVDHPGGPIGQDLLYNFLELQPYFDLE